MPTNKWAILGGIALNVDYTRKYGFDATAAAKVTAKLVAVPPPTLFQEAIQADLSGRVRRAIPPAGTGGPATHKITFSATAHCSPSGHQYSFPTTHYSDCR